MWCTYYKKPRHTKEKCWKLHGKPPNREWSSQKFHNQKKGDQGQINFVIGHNVEMGQLNHEEIEKVRSFMRKMNKFISMRVVIHYGKIPHSLSFNVLDTNFPHSVDIRFRSHRPYDTSSSIFFHLLTLVIKFCL